MKGLQRVFGFFTILPLSSAGTVEDVARAGYFIPLAGAVLGGAEGLIGWGSARIFGQPLAAAMVMAAALLLTGFHHADGLADLGDALMAHGDAARRIEVLKDRTMGVGAAGALLITYLISWAALLQLLSLRTGWQLVWSLMAVEIAARLSMLVVIAAGKPSHDGSGYTFILTMKGARCVAAIIMSLAGLALLFLVQPLTGVMAAGGAGIAAGIALTLAGKHWFGGAGGDIMGASVELGRMAALIGLVAAALP